MARRQLLALGVSANIIDRWVAIRRLVVVLDGVYGFPPIVELDDGRWMAATLTAPRTVLSHASAAAAWGMRPRSGTFETVTRPGRSGPHRQRGVLVCRSSTLAGETTTLRGIPITSGARTVLDLAPHLDDRSLSKVVREALRLRATTVDELRATLARHAGRRGVARVRAVVERVGEHPLRRARSDAEARALEILAAAERPLPQLNVRIAGLEADLSWREQRVIVEIDGPQYHHDLAYDADREARWTAAGYAVRRIGSADVFDAPHRLLALAPRA